MKEVIQRLKKYASKNQEDLQAAASDNLLPTLDLMELSKELIIAERDEKEGKHDYLPLMILHLRSTEDTLHKSLDLLDSDSTIDRQIGCRILREFPSLDMHPTKFSETIIDAMDKLIDLEDDESVLLSALSTIGWQCHDKGHEIMLRMSSDNRDNVRLTVAYNLLGIFDEERKITEETASVLLRYAKDIDEDIRRSVFYDIAEYPELFSDFKDEFKTAAEVAKNDSSLYVRSEAIRAFDSL